ncbi:LLM class flavin-dependent oxidoreductase [Nocardia sp. alder85J]|uniref:LLM class flavin-dependent oxidoreductase n=1 Tax=Nocardia sp. alder85J TaxID=2862949 RepID=UPI001CD80E2F|nr:LLM class flavin-dependent oxidoreductase [Nocardia sp. alder85J]MCX4098591.1 LLM class flavin-dependent oxidoreductase [Nocardia sp. alder85J]
MTAKTPTSGLEIGLYFDLRNPPHREGSASRLHGFTLDMCAEADRLGAGSLWFSEHHLFDDGYLTQPLTFAAAAAARTERARLGTAILIAPLHSPVEVAEQAALVDLISAGRLDLGIGTGYRKPEYELYGASDRRRYSRTDDMVRQLRRLWAAGGVTPQPVQQPIPVWLGYHGPQGARRAGLLGAPLLTPNADSWPAYRDGLVAGGHDPAVARMGGGVQAWVTEDPERDWPLVAPYIGYQVDSYRRHMVEGTDAPAPRPVEPEKLVSRDSGNPLSYFWFGTPETIAERIRELVKNAPVSTVYLWGSVGGMPEAMVAEHVRVVCTRLAPLLR